MMTAAVKSLKQGSRGPASSAFSVVRLPGLSPYRVSPDNPPDIPQQGAADREREVSMKLVRRITIALSSIAALALAGGAHWRAG